MNLFPPVNRGEKKVTQCAGEGQEKRGVGRKTPRNGKGLGLWEEKVAQAMKAKQEKPEASGREQRFEITETGRENVILQGTGRVTSIGAKKNIITGVGRGKTHYHAIGPHHFRSPTGQVGRNFQKGKD